MHAFSTPRIKFIRLLLVAIGLSSPCLAGAQDAGQQASSASTPDVTDLKFSDFFKMPVGPRGLQPTEKLLGLNGKRVRIQGYMARQDQPVAGTLLLTPLPVTMGDADEGLADDLPATAVFVHLDSGGRSVPYVPGLIRLSGVLSVGSQDEAGGRVSTVRLTLDAAASDEFLRTLQQRHASK
jgi:hypothetical protein